MTLNLFFFCRYDSIANDLEKSEREKQFDDQIDRLVAKKKDNYKKLLEECKEIRLDSSFKVKSECYPL